MAFEIVEEVPVSVLNANGEVVKKRLITAGFNNGDTMETNPDFARLSTAINADSGEVYFWNGTDWGDPQFSFQGS